MPSESIETIFTFKSLQNMTRTIGNLINHDIVIYSNQGFIVAANNEERIGLFSSLISRMLEAGEKSVTIYEKENVEGIRHGISVPIILEEKSIGAIGITGEPEDVGHYLNVIQYLIQQQLRELRNEININSYRSELTGLVYTWLLQAEGNYDGKFVSRSRNMGIDILSPRIICVMRICIEEGNVMFNSRLRTRIEQFLSERLRTNNNQNILASINGDLIGLILGNDYEKAFNLIENTRREANRYFGVEIAIGLVSTPFYSGNLNLYYETALKACEISMKSDSREMKVYDIFNPEFIVSAISDEYRANLCRHVFRNYNSNQSMDDSKAVIRNYIRFNRSIDRIATEMNIHRNTVQYKLNKITEMTGYDPHEIKDLIILYATCV